MPKKPIRQYQKLTKNNADRCQTCTKAYFWQEMVFLRYENTHHWICYHCWKEQDYTKYVKFNSWLQIHDDIRIKQILSKPWVNRPWVAAACWRHHYFGLQPKKPKNIKLWGNVDVTNYKLESRNTGRQLSLNENVKDNTYLKYVRRRKRYLDRQRLMVEQPEPEPTDTVPKSELEGIFTRHIAAGIRSPTTVNCFSATSIETFFLLAKLARTLGAKIIS
jgi:hypothetical protein